MKKIKLLTLVALGLMLMYGCKDVQEQQPVQSFDEIVASRRSVRNYDASKTISEEQVADLIMTAMEAPSWANQQPT